MKYKEGDFVRIKSLDWYEKNKGADESVRIRGHNWRFTLPMKACCGMTARITDVGMGFYKIDVDKDMFFWEDYMFEDENPFKTGDKVRHGMQDCEEMKTIDQEEA